MHFQIGNLVGERVNGRIARGEPLYYDPDQLINGHLVMLGDSGSGKTHNLRSYCTQLLETSASTLERIHIMDAHEDINVPASYLHFSQTTSYAYNPLEVSPDPHYGGVHRAINNFLGLLERSGRALGPQQQSVLRTILEEVYYQKGYRADNPSTWKPDPNQRVIAKQGRIYLDIPYEERGIAKEIARSAGAHLIFDDDPEIRCWYTDVMVDGLERWPQKSWGRTAPTLHDVIAHAELKLKQVFLGTDKKGVIALENYCRAQAAFARKARNLRKTIASGTEEEKARSDLEMSGEKAVDAIKEFIYKVQDGGDSLHELIRYQNQDTIKSILDRLKNLRATGVCRSVHPPFDNSQKIWRYGLRAYADSEKRIFVENLLERLFQSAITRGECNYIREIVIIDEAPIYLDSDTDHIIFRIINQARKFGLAIFLVAQSPTQFPEQILAGVGCKIILGLDPLYHQMASTKLALDKKRFEQIVPRRLIVVNQKVKGAVARWMPVLL